MKTYIQKGPFYDNPHFECGWGNGYVLIDEGHPLHGMEYDFINNLGIEIHGGLTFGRIITQASLIHFPGLDHQDIGKWMIGFDTGHAWDKRKTWPKKAVQAEADKLLQQIMDITEKLPL